MNKLLIIVLFTLSLLHAQENTSDELFKYSDVPVSDNISFYAAKVYMKSFEDDNSYSVGFLLNADANDNTDFGIGYMRSSDGVEALLNPSFNRLNNTKDDGILFFMSYKF